MDVWPPHSSFVFRSVVLLIGCSYWWDKYWNNTVTFSVECGAQFLLGISYEEQAYDEVANSFVHSPSWEADSNELLKKVTFLYRTQRFATIFMVGKKEFLIDFF
jgi:hypothetical protein